ncbi:LTA synthase family protein [Halobacillus hunanensis]|uniref:LTA synthase family protein n=1 Tax=Halobacillus hunanensis TaxID=578214 RepID=UPI0009A6F24B|nr:LTA synthase family protein [Halobacillus hunanensis]
MFKGKNYFNKNTKMKLIAYAIVIGMFWIKMYYVQSSIFDLGVENTNQAFIMAFNPLSSILLIFGIGILLAGRKGMLVSYILGSLLIYANVLFYREYSDFITIPMLEQVANLAGMGSSITNIMAPTDALLFIDVVIAAFLLFYLKPERLQLFLPKRKEGLILAIVAIPLFLVNLTWAETERTDLLERTFDRNKLVKFIGLINYHVYDAVLQGKTEMKRTLADSNELVPVINYLNETSTPSSDKYEGIIEGKNVIAISLESTQEFVVGKELHGQELTPYFNDLKEEGIYFDNFYHQVKQGRTSDSEFLLANSMYPLNRGAVFFTHSSNEYEAMPEVLSKNGYSTSVMHANDKTFWNRNVMYDSLGINKYFSKQDYKVTEENSYGWGLLDENFFAQSLEKMKNLEEPFYTRMITLTNHYPFTLPEDKKLIEEGNTSSATLNRYFQTIRYQDQALKQFVEAFKQSELYDNTILMIYGDHFGISENHQKAMGEYLGKDINEFEQFQLQQVPLLFYGKGLEPQENHTVGGQVDLRPTLMNMLGIEGNNPIQFGHDLLSEERRQLMITRDGDFASEKYVGIQGACYDRQTGEKIKSEKCEPFFKQAKEELNMSDSVIYGDLLRYLDETKVVEPIDEQQKQKPKE